MIETMEQSPQTLRSLLIPLQEGYAVLPNNTVSEILPFATPVAIDSAPSWVLGKLLWRAQIVPLLSLECLAFDMSYQPDTRSRIIVLKALNGDHRLPHFAILAASAPRLINLTRTAIVLNETGVTPVPGVLSRVRIGDLVGIVPNLDAIAAELARLVGREE